MSTADIIRPIITGTYGGNGMSRALIIYLADRIDKYEVDPQDERDNRERMILMTCWDWFPGGTTAENVASKIEAALEQA